MVVVASRARGSRDGDVRALLGALAEWQVLDRSHDGTRAASLAEYRSRHYVCQFTQAGYRASRAVEEALGAHCDLAHSPVQHTVSALPLVWDGAELIADSSGELAVALGLPPQCDQEQ